jgi:tripartite-type tricarboxylate transporter receptor subunit TctC
MSELSMRIGRCVLVFVVYLFANLLCDLRAEDYPSRPIIWIALGPGIVGGHIQVMFSDPLPSPPQIQAGNVRALGVSTITRCPTAPDIPTIDEAGVPGFDMSGWGMVALPAATPKDIIMRLHAELKDIIGSPEIQDQILNLGMLPGNKLFT